MSTLGPNCLSRSLRLTATCPPSPPTPRAPAAPYPLCSQVHNVIERSPLSRGERERGCRPLCHSIRKSTKRGVQRGRAPLPGGSGGVLQPLQPPWAGGRERSTPRIARPFRPSPAGREDGVGPAPPPSLPSRANGVCSPDWPSREGHAPYHHQPSAAEAVGDKQSRKIARRRFRSGHLFSFFSQTIKILALGPRLPPTFTTHAGRWGSALNPQPIDLFDR